MKTRLARRLTRLYPSAWRARYGDEFTAFLEERPSSIGAVVDIALSALRERIRGGARGFSMDASQRSLILMAWAYLAAVAAGVNFYWTVDDTAMIPAMHAHLPFWLSYQLVAGGALVAFAAVVAVALPVVLGMLRTAIVERRADVISRVAVPFITAAVTIAWLAAATVWEHWRWGGGWVPTPWDVNAHEQPLGWPPATARAALGSVTFVLLAAGWFASGIGVAQAIRRSDLSRHHRRWFTGTSIAVAASTGIMTIGVLAWGWFAAQYASAAFQATDGLLLDVPISVAWVASAIVFIASALVALRSARVAIGQP